MLVQEVMTHHVVTVREETRLREALRLLDQHEVTALPVIDGAGHVVGVVSEADLVTAIAAAGGADVFHGRPDGRRPMVVAEVMSRHPVVIAADADLTEALDVFAGGVFKMLPVVERGVIHGVLSRRDVIRTYARSDERLQGKVEDLLAEAEPGDRFVVTCRDGMVEISGGRDERARRVAAVLARTVPGVTEVTVAPADVVVTQPRVPQQ
ncbi:MAG: CBS domain-containing protein [Motilibacteraceae bacterium]